MTPSTPDWCPPGAVRRPSPPPASLPLAVQDGPPVVGPGLQPSLRRAAGDVLVVAGGEQDMLPCRIGLHA